jgi:hypothetical protein
VPENVREIAVADGVLWGVPQDDGRPLLRIIGNVLSGRFSVERTPMGITLDDGNL